MASQRSKLPTIDCVFQMDTSGQDMGQGGAFGRDGSEVCFGPGAGIWHTAGSGAFVMQGARLYATQADFRFNGYNTQGDGKSALRAEHCAEVHATLARVTDAYGIGVEILGASQGSLRDGLIARCGKEGVSIGGVSSVHLRGVDIEDCSESAILAAEGCHVRVLAQSLQRCKNGIYATGGSRVNGSQLVIGGCSNVGTRSEGIGSLVSLTASSVAQSGSFGIQSRFGGRTNLTSSSVQGSNTKDLSAVSAGEVFLRGVVETTSGTTWQNNLADSNVSQFGGYTADKSRIYGRG
jgi:hypothetical protein